MIKHNFFFLFFLTKTLTILFAQNTLNHFDENGKRHGYWSKDFPHTKLKRYEGHFFHGKEIDTFKFYKVKNNKSVLSAIKIFDKTNDYAEVIFYTSTRKIVSKGIMHKKNFIGKWLYYHKDSDKVMIEENYNNIGQLEGVKRLYNTKGLLLEEVNYKNNLRHGKATHYNEESKKIREINYKADKFHGIYTSYDGSGNINKQGYYDNDNRIGLWKYYKDGILIKTKDFSDVKSSKK